MTALRRIALTAVAAPLALALAACGSDEQATEGAPKGEPIAAVPAPAGTSWVETAAVTPEDGYRIGNPDAPLKLVEYASHTCPACAAFSTSAVAELDEYVAKGVVSYEIRNQVHNALDLTLAMLMRCGAPETFHPLANQVWANLDQVMNTAQQNEAALNQAMQAQDATRFQKIADAAGLLDFFAARGISRDQAMQCLADPAKGEAILQRSQAQSEELEVTGTPTFFLNGSKLEGSNWAEIEPILQNAGAR
ncbi:thioredoxin domain-containing protein [Altererythrobacter soli]|uniref:Thioredoxin domain-containing protein n=1 Tax=Croceibacterium soli TaxID=1739690 RepID=A0A6I4V0W6_9SPHN|nr:thioredoxin domain-containing protein [Croceibacterium soli]MXP42635.1 thioredoxin domain-containing protein [Croceibacterium soli]